MNLLQLQNFLSQNEIPKIKRHPKTFLGIAKQPHYENVMSNIYAFYFNFEEEHQLNDLFIKSFIELILKQQPQKEIQNFNDFDVCTEYSTNNDGRIDILITDGNQHLIIENKVYHHIEDNDLIDYWHTVVKQGQEKTSIGVILSLNVVDFTDKPGKENFINITHLDFMNKVLSNIGDYILNANETYLPFLKDFIQNINNLSTKMMEAKELDFYLENQQKINDLLNFKSLVETHVKKEIENVVSSIDGVFLNSSRSHSNRSNITRDYVSKINKNLMFTIYFDHLLNGEKKLIIAIKLQNEVLEDRSVFQKKDFSKEELEICFTDHFIKKNDNWARFALKEYTLSNTDIHNLSKFIEIKIKEDHFLSVFKKIEKLLTALKIK